MRERHAIDINGAAESGCEPPHHSPELIRRLTPVGPELRTLESSVDVLPHPINDLLVLSPACQLLFPPIALENLPDGTIESAAGQSTRQFSKALLRIQQPL